MAFVFADTTEAKVDNTVAALEDDGRRYWAPRRYDTFGQGITARDYGQAVPVLVTTLEQLQQHGADGPVWRRLGRRGEQTLTAALDNLDGEALYRDQMARADERVAQAQGRRTGGAAAGVQAVRAEIRCRALGEGHRARWRLDGLGT